MLGAPERIIARKEPISLSICIAMLYFQYLVLFPATPMSPGKPKPKR
jgi:hypothetical protein